MRIEQVCRVLVVLSAATQIIAQESLSHTWSASCSDCESSILNPGWYSDGSGIFVEAMRGGKVAVLAGVSVSEGNFVVATGFGEEAGGSPIVLNPSESVTIETDSAPHMVLHPLSRPDPKIPRKDVSVKKQFANKQITINPDGSTAAGYLFFPSDVDAKHITVVVRIGEEVFRFPFLRNPNARAKFGSDSAESIATAEPVSPQHKPSLAASALAPLPAGSSAASSDSSATKLMSGIEETKIVKSDQSQPSGACLKNVSFAVAENGQITTKAPKFTAKWIEKNARKYPGLCFSQQPNPQAANFVIVFSTSRSAFSGIYPTVRTNTQTTVTPVSGSGTITSSYGSIWNYTYQGTETTTATTTSQVNLPYTDTTTGLYAYSYSQSGA